MPLVTTTTDAGPTAPEPLGDLGRFRFRSVLRLVQPALQIAKPLMNVVGKTGVVGKGGGLLAAMGPWGWAAGAALAAGGTAAALIARQRRRQRQARARREDEAAAAAAAAPPMPAPDQPPADAATMYAPQPTYGYQTPYAAEPAFMPAPEAMTVSEPMAPPMTAPDAEAVVPGTVPAIIGPLPDDQPAEAPRVVDAEVMPPETAPVNGLGADPSGTGIPWGLVATMAALGAVWWLAHEPAGKSIPRRRRRRRQHR